MIRKLHIDKVLDSTSRSDRWYTHSTIAKCSKSKEAHKFQVEDAMKKMMKDGVEIGAIAKVLSVIKDDVCAVNTICSLSRYYHAGDFTNYVVSQPLLEVLTKMKADMPIDLLPNNYKACFELNGYLGIGTALIHLESEDGEKVVRVTAIGVEGESWHSGGSVKEGENIRDSLSRFGFTINDMGGELDINYDEEVKIKNRIFTTLFNLMIYTVNPNEDFVAEFNKFSPSPSLRKIQKKKFTDQEYVKIGFSAEFLRLVTVDTSMVAPFPRWQPCGPGSRQRKLIMVKAHPRNYKKFKAVV